MKTLQIKKLHPSAVLPVRSTPSSAGYDLSACIENPVTIKPDETVVIPTGLAIGLEDTNSVALIYPRSSLSVKYSITLPNTVGVIDADYRGEIVVPLRNLSSVPYTIQPGDRIAQMVIQPIYTPELIEIDELTDTLRGANGFGSTGK